MIKQFTLAAGLIAAAALSGCGGGGTDPVMPVRSVANTAFGDYLTAASTNTNLPVHYGKITALRDFKNTLQAISGADAFDRITNSNVAVKTINCAVGGTVTSTVTDANTNNVLDSGDSITYAFANCSNRASESLSGEIKVAVSTASIVTNPGVSTVSTLTGTFTKTATDTLNFTDANGYIFTSTAFTLNGNYVFNDNLATMARTETSDVSGSTMSASFSGGVLSPAFNLYSWVDKVSNSYSDYTNAATETQSVRSHSFNYVDINYSSGNVYPSKLSFVETKNPMTYDTTADKYNNSPSNTAQVNFTNNLDIGSAQIAFTGNAYSPPQATYKTTFTSTNVPETYKLVPTTLN